jgi:hypothetical protein
LVFQWVQKNLLRYSPICYEANFLRWLLTNKDLKNNNNPDLWLHTYFVGDVLSLSNSRFGDYLSLIYPNEIEDKNTPDIPSTPP